MHLKSCADVYKIYERALVIRHNTPYSFRILASNLEIFRPGSKNLDKLFRLYDIENLIAIPIFASEIFSIAYNNIVDCPDEYCYNFQKGIFQNKKEIKLIGNRGNEGEGIEGEGIELNGTDGDGIDDMGILVNEKSKIEKEQSKGNFVINNKSRLIYKIFILSTYLIINI